MGDVPFSEGAITPARGNEALGFGLGMLLAVPLLGLLRCFNTRRAPSCTHGSNIHMKSSQSAPQAQPRLEKFQFELVPT